MADSDEKKDSWKSRNKEIKSFTVSGKRGWVKLIIGENREKHNRFLRLKKYLNWFSIPDAHSLSIVRGLLERGAKHLDWEHEDTTQIKFKDSSIPTTDQNIKIANEKDIPEEVLSFVKNNPQFTKKLISLDLNNSDPDYLLSLMESVNEALSKSGERLKVAFRELIQKISKEGSDGIQNLSDLMNKMNLYQITSLSSIVKSRLDVIETFEQLITDEKTYEINTDSSIHRLLEKSMWIFDEDYWIVQSNKTLRTFIGDEIVKRDKKNSRKRPDFACVNFENKLIIIEIKRPSIELGREEIDQAELYHLMAKKYKANEYGKIEIYLVGNKISSEARELIDLRKGTKLVTYNDILQKCKKRYQNYLKVVEEQKIQLG